MTQRGNVETEKCTECGRRFLPWNMRSGMCFACFDLICDKVEAEVQAREEQEREDENED
jgi:uncharacterized OB-fold protein